MIFVYITCKNKSQAIKISKHLLQKRLIACANIHPINSVYLWNGKITNGKEFALIGKTADKNYEKIKDEVKKIHSYDIPCVIKIKVDSNPDYEKWVNSEIVR